MRRFLFGSLVCSSLAFALPQEARVPGGIALLPLPATLPATVQASYESRPVFVDIAPSGERHVVVGIPLSAPVGEAAVELKDIKTGTALETLRFDVAAKSYPEQHIKLPANSRHVHPGPAELARYALEAAEQQAVYRQFSATGNRWPDFILPTTGRINPNFGLKRFFNGEPRNPHLGLDIPAPIGQPVLAPAAGLVVQTGDYFFNGRTVMIDHGQGLVSMLCHLDQISVKAGDLLRQGDVIGLVGKTGRATGPHLHWTLSLNDARIDPLLVLPADTKP